MIEVFKQSLVTARKAQAGWRPDGHSSTVAPLEKRLGHRWFRLTHEETIQAVADGHNWEVLEIGERGNVTGPIDVPVPGARVPMSQVIDEGPAGVDRGA